MPHSRNNALEPLWRYDIAALHQDLPEVEASLEVHNKASTLHYIALLRS